MPRYYRTVVPNRLFTRNISTIAALALGSTTASLLAFALCLWANSGPVDGGTCDVYCGPANPLVAIALTGLVPITWLIAASMTITALITKNRRTAIVCTTGLLIPVTILSLMYVTSD